MMNSTSSPPHQEPRDPQEDANYAQASATPDMTAATKADASTGNAHKSTMNASKNETEQSKDGSGQHGVKRVQPDQIEPQEEEKDVELAVRLQPTTAKSSVSSGGVICGEVTLAEQAEAPRQEVLKQANEGVTASSPTETAKMAGQDTFVMGGATLGSPDEAELAEEERAAVKQAHLRRLAARRKASAASGLALGIVKSESLFIKRSMEEKKDRGGREGSRGRQRATSSDSSASAPRRPSPGPGPGSDMEFDRGGGNEVPRSGFGAVHEARERGGVQTNEKARGRMRGLEIEANEAPLRQGRVPQRTKHEPRKRKMSATPPPRASDHDLMHALYQQQARNDELDVTQSMMTLQLNRRGRGRGTKRIRADDDAKRNDLETSPIMQRSAMAGGKQGDASTMHIGKHPRRRDKFVLRSMVSGIGPNEDEWTNNQNLNIYRRLSIFASNGYEDELGRSDGRQSDIDVDRSAEQEAKDADDGDGGDDDKQSGGSQAGEDSDQDLSVDLQDDDLDLLAALEIESTRSYSGLDGPIRRAISQAEASRERQREPDGDAGAQRQPEEYESLVWGQSIWSTDIPKESQRIFMANLQQMQSSDALPGGQQTSSSGFRNKNSSINKGSGADPSNGDKKDEDEEDFDELHQTIQEEAFGGKAPAQAMAGPSESKQMPNEDSVGMQATTQPQESVYYCYENQTGHHDHQQDGSEQLMVKQATQQDHYFIQQPSQSLGLQLPMAQSNTPIDQVSASAQQQQPYASTSGYVPEQEGAAASFGNQPYMESGQQPPDSAISVHSGGPHAFGAAVFGADVEFPGDASSNYTHHPYSAYGNPHASEHPAQGQHGEQEHQQQQAFMQYGGGGPGQPSYGLNRPHLYINRQINRYMMNPIYRSRQTLNSLQMHRLSGVPWRGGSQNQNAMLGQAFGAQLTNNTFQMQQQPQQPHENHEHYAATGMPDMMGNMQQQWYNEKPVDMANAPAAHLNQQMDSQGMLPTASQSQAQANEGAGANPSATEQTPHFNTGGQAFQQNLSTAAGNQSFNTWVQQQSMSLSKEQQQMSQAALTAPPFYPKQHKEDVPKDDGMMRRNSVTQADNSLAKALTNLQNRNAGGNQMRDLRQKQPATNFMPIPIPIIQRGHHAKGKGTQGFGQKANKFASMTSAVDPATGRPLHQEQIGRVYDSAMYDVNIEGANRASTGGNLGFRPETSNERQLLYGTFYGGEDILQKKNELDQKMKITTQHLEQKINKAREIDKEVDEHDDDDEEDEDTHQFTFDVLSVGQCPSDAASVERESVINKSLNEKTYKALLAQGSTQVNITQRGAPRSSFYQQDQLEKMIDQNLSPADKNDISVDQQELGGGGAKGIPQVNSASDIEMKQQRDREALEQLQVQRTNAKIKQYEDKVKRRNDRDQIFKKLQEEINQFKTEMFMGSDQVQSGASLASSISPKRQNIFKPTADEDRKTGETKKLAAEQQEKAGMFKKKLLPFRQDANQYLDKVLNLMNMINEVDDVTNVAELKNKLEKKVLQLKKARLETKECGTLASKLQQENNLLRAELKDAQHKMQAHANENQNLIANINQIRLNEEEMKQFNERQLFEMRSKVDMLGQEKHDLILQNTQLQEQNQILTQQVSQLKSQANDLQQNVYGKHQQVQQLTSQMDLLNQRQMSMQQYQQELCSAQEQQASLQKALADQTSQNAQLKQQLQESSAALKSSNAGSYSRPSSGTQASAKDQPPAKKTAIKKKTKVDRDGDSSESESSSSSDSSIDLDNSEIPVEEQLQNANKQVRQLQEYIKKKSIEDFQKTEEWQERLTKLEKEHAEQLTTLKDENDQNMQLFNKIKEFFKEKVGADLDGQESIEDQLKLCFLQTPEGPCAECKTKSDKITDLQQKLEHTSQLNREAIRQQLQLMRSGSSSSRSSKRDMASAFTQTDHKEDKEQKSDKSDRKGGELGANHKILLNNYLRHLKVYLDRCDDESCKTLDKMKERLDMIAAAQHITLFDEDDDSNDEGEIKPELIQQIVDVSLDMTYELIVVLLAGQPKKETKVTTVYRTIDFGLTMANLKDMQSLARGERKQCHQIIVEIEKQIYDFNSQMTQMQQAVEQDEQLQKQLEDASVSFGQIQTTYLKLPHRLKPVFDHCKKLESVITKAFKSQEEVLSKQQQTKS